MSERFRLPDEALPSEPPPAAPLGDRDEPPAASAATAHIPIPERIKLLNAALPTPHAFAPEPVVVPPTPAVPDIARDVPRSDAPLEAAAASERPARVVAPSHPARRRHVVNALALFVILLGSVAIALRLCASFLFE